jgi:hypothetical protein
VDQTKTEPKPAFYKLQFGDDVTGFNYYVRTTTVVIGRNCVGCLKVGSLLDVLTVEQDMKGAPLPPPDERHLGGPTKPPLDTPGEKEDVKPELPLGLDSSGLEENVDIAGELGLSSEHVIDEGPGPEVGAVNPTPDVVMSPKDAPVANIESAEKDSGLEATTTEGLSAPAPPLMRTTSEDQVEIKVEHPEPLAPIDTHTASSAPPEAFAHAPLSPQLGQRPLSAPPTTDAALVDMDIFDSIDPDALEALVLAATSDSPPPPPPPPPPPVRTASESLEHVDVDLGPLKSVSRNHAKISYFADLGHFCLEILGRNGAWVDDRYFVRGSTVPLNQG